MTTLQRICFAVLGICYLLIIVAIFRTSQLGEALTFLLFGSIAFAIGILLLTIVLRIISFLRISTTDTFIISFSIPILLLGMFFIKGHFFENNTQNNIQNKHQYEARYKYKGWEVKYDGSAQTVLAASQKYAEDSVLHGSEYEKYFTVVNLLSPDSTLFEACYFYADHFHPDTPSAMVLHINTDKSGHILSSEQFSTDDSTRYKKMFQQEVELFSLGMNLVDSLKRNE